MIKNIYKFLTNFNYIYIYIFHIETKYEKIIFLIYFFFPDTFQKLNTNLKKKKWFNKVTYLTCQSSPIS